MHDSSATTLLARIYDTPRFSVFRGRFEGKPAVFKVVRRDADEGTRSALAREIDVLRQLESPYVPRLLGSTEIEGVPAAVFADAGGRPLRDLVEGGSVPVEHIAVIGQQIARALMTLHGIGLAHRDVNPSNVLWIEETRQVLLIDFELAAPFGSADAAMVGTVGYMAPEQTGRVAFDVDERTDLFGLGATLYALCVGKAPFAGADTVEVVHRTLTVAPPAPVRERPEVPDALSAIIQKLLEKTPDDRYASAFGVACDLERAIALVDAGNPRGSFTLGERDGSPRFVIPDRLFGRERESAVLVDAVTRAARGGNELVLVAGPSGIGKSACVREAAPAVVAAGGRLVSGKFEQFKRGVPYLAIAQALNALCREIGGVEAKARATMVETLRARLGDIIGVIAEIAPAFEDVVGPCQSPPHLEPEQAQNRLAQALDRFFRGVAEALSPVVLMLDDVQWADAGSLQVLSTLCGPEGPPSLLVIAAYRDNEIDETHPFATVVRRLREAGREPVVLDLKPLDAGATRKLVAAATRRDDAPVPELAAIVSSKTGDNPFFIKVFLSHLATNGLLRYDYEARNFTWSIADVRRQETSANVVDLLLDRMRRLAPEHQTVISLAACVGAQFDPKTLELAIGSQAAGVASAVATLVRLGFVEGSATHYSFVHDRVQQAAYDLLPERERLGAHLRIGRSMRDAAKGGDLESAVFEVVGHLNLARPLLSDAREIAELARFNLLAGEVAQRSSAYGPAVGYLEAARQGFPSDIPPTDAENARLVVALARSYNVVGRFEEGVALLEGVVASIKDPIAAGAAYETLGAMYEARGRYRDAIHACFRGLALFGIRLPKKGSKVDVAIQSMKTKLKFRAASIEWIERIEPVDDAAWQATLALASRAAPSAYLEDPDLFVVMSLRVFQVAYSRKLYVDNAAFVMIFALIMIVLRDVPKAKRLRRVAWTLRERAPSQPTDPLFYVLAGHWGDVLEETYEECVRLEEEAFRRGMDFGDPANAGVAAFLACLNALGGGFRLPQISSLAERYRKFFDQRPNTYAYPLYFSVRQLARSLLGTTSGRGELTDEAIHEDSLVAMSHNSPGNRAIYGVMKAFAAFDAGRYDEAASIALRNPVPLALPACFTAALNFTVLGLSLSHGGVAAKWQRIPGVRRLIVNLIVLELAWWGRSYRYVAAGLSSLVRGEWAASRGKVLVAQRAFVAAISRLDDSRQYYWGAVARRALGESMLASGQSAAAAVYIQQAIDAFAAYGAHNAAEDLKQRHETVLLESNIRTAPTRGSSYGSSVRSSFGASVASDSRNARSLDFASLVKASFAISAETDIDRLGEELLRITIENGGATYGALVMLGDAAAGAPEATIELVGRMSDDGLFTVERTGHSWRRGEDCALVPAAVLRRVLGGEDEIVVNNVESDDAWRGDRALGALGVRSFACVPIVTQGARSGCLFLSNERLAGAFTVDRVASLRVLAAQGAIALKNARHVHDIVAGSQRISHLNSQLSKVLEGSRAMAASSSIEGAVQAALAACEGELDWSRGQVCRLVLRLESGELMTQVFPTDAMRPALSDAALAALVRGDVPGGGIAAPIVINGERVGCLVWETVDGRQMDADDERFVATLSQSLGLSLRNIEHRTHLGELVQIRTKELGAALDDVTSKSRKIRAIMESIEQGILTVNADLRIESEHSAFVGRLLGDSGIEVGGARVGEVLRRIYDISADELSRVEEVLNVSIGEDEINWTLNGGNLPREAQAARADGTRKFELDWTPMVNTEGAVERVMLAIRDVTEQRALEEHLAEQDKLFQRKAKALSTMVRIQPDLLGDFLDDARLRLDAVIGGVADTAALMRDLHTIKGSARTLGFADLARLAHDAESALSAGAGNAAAQTLGEELRYLGEVFNEIFRRSGGAGDQWTLYQFVGQLAGGLETLAREDELSITRLEVDDRVVSWAVEHRRTLVKVLPHCMSNALDHGYRLPLRRGVKVGPVAIVVDARAARDKGVDGIAVRVVDAGAGLDLEALRVKAAKLGLGGDPTEVIFHDGVSTADAVTETSGRGVGMSAVRRMAREIGGDVTVEPRPGGGVVCRIFLPDAQRAEGNGDNRLIV